MIKIVLSLGIFLFLCATICFGQPTLAPIVLDEIEDWICLENHALYFVQQGGSNNHDPSEILTGHVEFKPYDNLPLDSKGAIWIKFSIESNLPNDETLNINCKFYDEVLLYDISGDYHPSLINATGYLTTYHRSKDKNWNANVSFKHPKQSKKTYLLGLISHTRNSKQLSTYFTSNCAKLYLEKSFIKDYKIPKSLLFFFLGGILMMSCYNLGIAIATNYKEYILFSMYNLCFVLLGIVLSNLHIDLGWITPFNYERTLRYVPAILCVPFYLLFTIHFLEVKSLNHRLYKVLFSMVWVFVALLIGLLFSYFKIVFIVYTALTLPLLVCVLYISLIRAFQNEYARYFLCANLLLLSVGVLQLISLYGVISISKASVYSIISLMFEIVLFSFAVAIKLKVTRKELYLMRVKNQMQKERITYEMDLKEKLENEVDKKSRALTSSSIQWINTTKQLDEVKKRIKENLKEHDKKLYKELIKQIEEIEVFEDHWNSFKLHFESVHKDFFEKIERKFPMLSQNDLKLCAFVKMKLSNKEIALILNVTKKAVEQSKRRMRKKIGLDSEQDILEYMENSKSEALQL